MLPLMTGCLGLFSKPVTKTEYKCPLEALTTPVADPTHNVEVGRDVYMSAIQRGQALAVANDRLARIGEACRALD
jgi:hypothetical protein